MKLPALEIIAALAVAASVVASGIYVVKAKHESRTLFAELQELERERDRLQIDWWRLQLEQSTWATHPRIEALARDRLGLEAPNDAEIEILVEPGT